MEFRYRIGSVDGGKLPFGTKLRMALAGLSGLAIFALVLSVSAALFLVLAPIVLAGGAIGAWYLRRKLRAAREQQMRDAGVVDADYVVVERDARDPSQRLR